MMKSLRIGYVPLTDAALLHVANAQHFAAARGVEIELVADSSWANIRDKLVAGHFDAAPMLARCRKRFEKRCEKWRKAGFPTPGYPPGRLPTIGARRRQSGEAPLTFA